MFVNRCFSEEVNCLEMESSRSLLRDTLLHEDFDIDATLLLEGLIFIGDFIPDASKETAAAAIFLSSHINRSSRLFDFIIRSFMSKLVASEFFSENPSIS